MGTTLAGTTSADEPGTGRDAAEGAHPVRVANPFEGAGRPRARRLPGRCRPGCHGLIGFGLVGPSAGWLGVDRRGRRGVGTFGGGVFGNGMFGVDVRGVDVLGVGVGVGRRGGRARLDGRARGGPGGLVEGRLLPVCR